MLLARVSFPVSVLVLGLAPLLACEMENPVASAQSLLPKRLRVSVLADYPHDPGAFTQGLLWHDGKLYESTGNYGRSSLREVRLETGDVIRQVNLRPEYFAEGLARVGRQLVQLTWREGAALVYDLRRLRQSELRSFTGEGWGLCYDGSHLIMSDGSDILTIRDPATMAVWKKVPVTSAGKPVKLLNELEFAEGWIYANVWQSTEIVRIEPRTGRVDAVVDASILLSKLKWPPRDVLNGIAYAPDRGTFFLTGKYWPKVFEVKFE